MPITKFSFTGHPTLHLWVHIPFLISWTCLKLERTFICACQHTSISLLVFQNFANFICSRVPLLSSHIIPRGFMANRRGLATSISISSRWPQKELDFLKFLCLLGHVVALFLHKVYYLRYTRDTSLCFGSITSIQ